MPRAHAGPDADHLGVRRLVGDDLVEQRHQRGVAAVHDRQAADLDHVEVAAGSRRTGDSVPAISALSISDSRISRETTCWAPRECRSCGALPAVGVVDDGADRLAVERGGELAGLQAVDELDLADVARVAASARAPRARPRGR